MCVSDDYLNLSPRKSEYDKNIYYIAVDFIDFFDLLRPFWGNLKRNALWNKRQIIYFFLFKVRCFSACTTILSSTKRPFLRRTSFINLLALVPESTLITPSSSSSEVGS